MASLSARECKGSQDPEDESELTNSRLLPSILNGRWELGERVGGGASARIFAVTDLSRGLPVIAKVENIALIPTWHSTVAIEKEVYEALSALSSNLEGFARMFFHLKRGYHEVIVITRLGHSLGYWRKRFGGEFCIKTALMIGIQGVTLLEQLHIAGYVHRDIHADNILTGEDDTGTLYLIAFGVANKISTSERSRYERVADMLSLGKLVTGVFSSGFDHVEGSSVFAYNEASVEDVVQVFRESCGISEVRKFVEDASKLAFDKKSDYQFLRSILREGLKRRGLTEDNAFEWISTTEWRSQRNPWG